MNGVRNEGLEKRDERHVETDWWGKWGKTDVTLEMGRSPKISKRQRSEMELTAMRRRWSKNRDKNRKIREKSNKKITQRQRDAATTFGICIRALSDSSVGLLIKAILIVLKMNQTVSRQPHKPLSLWLHLQRVDPSSPFPFFFFCQQKKQVITAAAVK